MRLLWPRLQIPRVWHFWRTFASVRRILPSILICLSRFGYRPRGKQERDRDPTLALPSSSPSSLKQASYRVDLLHKCLLPHRRPLLPLQKQLQRRGFRAKETVLG